MGTLRSRILATLNFHLTHGALPREAAGPQLPASQDARIQLQTQDEQRMETLAPYAGNAHDSQGWPHTQGTPMTGFHHKNLITASRG